MGQQTILRVQTNKVNTVTVGVEPLQETYDLPIFETLDLYKSIPIKINKSYAEIQDISKKNSDYSVPVALPGSTITRSLSLSAFFQATSRCRRRNAAVSARTRRPTAMSYPKTSAATAGPAIFAR